MTFSRADIAELIIAAVESLGLSGHPIDLDTRLVDLGIDLPDLVELTNVSQVRWGLEMTTDELDSAETVGEIVDRISGEAGVV